MEKILRRLWIASAVAATTAMVAAPLSAQDHGAPGGLGSTPDLNGIWQARR
jgi:hypothetical protein